LLKVGQEVARNFFAEEGVAELLFNFTDPICLELYSASKEFGLARKEFCRSATSGKRMATWISGSPYDAVDDLMEALTERHKRKKLASGQVFVVKSRRPC
jgi:hypothetical protein